MWLACSRSLKVCVLKFYHVETQDVPNIANNEATIWNNLGFKRSRQVTLASRSAVVMPDLLPCNKETLMNFDLMAQRAISILASHKLCHNDIKLYSYPWLPPDYSVLNCMMELIYFCSLITPSTGIYLLISNVCFKCLLCKNIYSRALQSTFMDWPYFDLVTEKWYEFYLHLLLHVGIFTNGIMLLYYRMV